MGNCINYIQGDSTITYPRSESSIGERALITSFFANWKEDTKSIWSRPSHKLPIHTDIPKLFKKIKVFSVTVVENSLDIPPRKIDRKLLFDGSSTEMSHNSINQSVKLFLEILSKNISDERMYKNIELFDKIAYDGNISDKITKFLNYFSEESPQPTVLVLKGINEKIIFPAICLMKEKFQPKLGRFSDEISSWNVYVEIESDIVRIIHMRRFSSQNYSTNESDLRIPEFSFTCNLIMEVNLQRQQLEQEKLTIQITDVSVAENLPEKKRNY